MKDSELLIPYKIQLPIIERFEEEDCAGLFLGCGFGKSLIAANLVRYKMNSENEILQTIILCPVIMLEKWKKELLLSTRIPANLIGVVRGSRTKKRFHQGLSS